MTRRSMKLVVTHRTQWGPGKVHAAQWAEHWLWGRSWYPICSGDHMHIATETTKTVSMKRAREEVTCKKCTAKLAWGFELPTFIGRRA